MCIRDRYGAVTKPAVRADLEGMKRVGLRGTYLMPIRGVDEKPEYGGQARQLSPEFWDVVEYAMHCADSLGLELGVHICDGFALADMRGSEANDALRYENGTVVTATNHNGGIGGGSQSSHEIGG